MFVATVVDRKNTSFSFLGERMEKNEKLGYQLIGSRKFTKSIAATGTIARQGVVVFI